MATLPAIGPPSISVQRPRNAAMLPAWRGWRAVSSAMPSAQLRPASCAMFQAGLHTSARNRSMAASSPGNIFR